MIQGKWLAQSFRVVFARVLLMGVLSAAAAGLAAGCATTGETAQRDLLSEHVGKYDPPPAGAVKPRVGVPPFKVTTGQGFSGGAEGELEGLAADQMTTLLDQSGRFEVIERTNLSALIQEQSLEGIVKSDELAKSAQVSGVDYLLLGKVTNLRVKTENKSTGLGVGQITGKFFNAGAADVKKTDIIITSECGVDIRLVDPSTGKVVPGTANFSEYKKTDTAGAMGVDILGASAEADASIQISDDDKGKILRLALDDAVRKTLPRFDKFLTGQNVKRVAKAAATPAPVTPAAVNTVVETPKIESPAPAVAGRKFCPECGKEVAAGMKFCPADGTKIP